jgi:glycerol kinase
MPIQRARFPEITALGAAYLAGLAVGIWHSTEEIAQQWQSSTEYYPTMSEAEREHLYSSWKKAVERSKGWMNP